MLISLGRVVLMSASTLSLACGALPRFSADEVDCRSAVTPELSRPDTPVRWYYIDDDQDRTFQNAWCAGVGPAVVWSAPEPIGEELLAGAADERRAATGTSVDPDSLTSELPVLDSLLLVAYNAHIGVGDLAGLVRDIREGELTGAPVTHFALLLQEVHREGPNVPPDEELVSGTPTGSRTGAVDRTGIVQWARGLRLHLFYAPSMRNGIGYPDAQDRGNAILSTLPLSDLRALELPAGIQRRVALVASVRGRTSAGNEWLLGISSTHLDNADITSPLASLGAVRARQASGLVRMLPDDRPLVVGGDFNTWFRQREERAYRIMRDDFPYPIAPQLSPTADRLGAGRIIDWLFFRGPEGWTFDDARADSRYGSDHFPIYGWVRIPPGGFES